MKLGVMSESQATAFFDTLNREGKWWLVDPEGHLFLDEVLGRVVRSFACRRGIPFKDLSRVEGECQQHSPLR